MNWESERDMARDVEENPELYKALSASPDDDDTLADLLEQLDDE